jgi:hypothetical protein
MNGWKASEKVIKLVLVKFMVKLDMFLLQKCSRLGWKIDRYDPKDIANGDDMTFLLSVLPSKTLCSRGERCSYAKHLKADCLQIEKPVVIERDDKP